MKLPLPAQTDKNSQKHQNDAKNTVKDTGAVAAENIHKKAGLVVVHEPVKIFRGTEYGEQTGENGEQALEHLLRHRCDSIMTGILKTAGLRTDFIFHRW